MELRLLGPLEVVVDGAALPLGGPKQRTVLAVLAHAAPRAVPVHVLLDAVWDDDPGPRAETTLQVYVSNLRRALAGTPMRIIGEAGGYRLDTHGVVVDRDVVQAGPAGLVALFRGPAGVDLAPGRFAEQVARDVAELHASAAEQDADVRLARGEHAALVPVLQQLCREHPVRERLWGQLVLALYRCDRQAEALAAYAELRRHLDEELGLSPSPALQQLHEQVLRQDPALGVPSTTVEEPAPAVQVERSLPLTLSTFVGRAAELEALLALVEAHRLVTVVAFGGMGKTRLALEAAREWAGGEVTFVDLSQVTDARRVPDTIASALGGDPGGEDPVASVAALLATGPRLLVLDNLEQLLPSVADVILSLLDRAPDLRVLGTSREPLDVRGESVLRLGPLAESKELFLARAAQAVTADDPLLDEVCSLLDGWPLAVELAAARAGTLGTRGLRSRLVEARALPAGPRDLPERQRTLDATIRWSVDLLDEDALQVLNTLAAFPGGAALSSLESMCGRDVVADLDRLVGASLANLTEDPDGEPRARLLVPVQQHLLRALGPQLGTATVRHAEHVRDLVESVVAYQPIGETVVAKVSAELDNVRAAVATFVGLGRVGDERQLVSAFVDPLWHLGRMSEIVDLCQDALSRPDPERRHEAALLQALGVALSLSDRGGPGARALMAQSVEAARETGATHQEVMSLIDQSQFLVLAGDDAGAAEALRAAYERALLLTPEPQRIRLSDRASSLATVSWVRAEAAAVQGDLDQAEELAEGGVRIARDGAPHELMYTLKRRALVRMLQGRNDLAMVDLDEQLRLTEGLPMMRAEVLSERSWARLLSGDLEGAEADALATLALRNDNTRSQAVATWVHVQVLLLRGEAAAALEVAQACTDAIPVENHGWHVLPRLARAQALRALGQTAPARQQLAELLATSVVPPMRTALRPLLLELANCVDAELAAGVRHCAQAHAAEPGMFMLRLLTPADPCAAEGDDPGLSLDEALRLALGAS